MGWGAAVASRDIELPGTGSRSAGARLGPVCRAAFDPRFDSRNADENAAVGGFDPVGTLTPNALLDLGANGVLGITDMVGQLLDCYPLHGSVPLMACRKRNSWHGYVQVPRGVRNAPICSESRSSERRPFRPSPLSRIRQAFLPPPRRPTSARESLLPGRRPLA